MSSHVTIDFQYRRLEIAFPSKTLPDVFDVSVHNVQAFRILSHFEGKKA